MVGEELSCRRELTNREDRFTVTGPAVAVCNQTFYYCGARAQENIVNLFSVPVAIWKHQ